MEKITTAVFPVAGLGTRFLPVTKTGPKEMLPIVDKPLIQYIVEEAIAAGIEKVVLVTSNNKHAIEDYFDCHYELESYLSREGKMAALSLIRNIVPPHVSIVYVRQPTPAGLGDAVLRSKSVVGNAPFAVLLADDLIDCPDKPCLQSMIEVYEQTGASVLAVATVPPNEVNQYGIVSLGKNNVSSNAYQVKSIIEKPPINEAPSRFGVVGRYILTPRIFPLLESTKTGVGGEIQLTDAIARLLEEEAVVAYPFDGKRYDCGSKIGFIEATIVYALRRPELASRLRARLAELVSMDESLYESVIE